MKLGDAIATVATPIARALNMSCIDSETNQLRPESPCAQAKNRLNNGEALFTVLYDRFFEKRTKGEKVNFILQVEVEADDVVQALAKKSEGTVLSINPRPQQVLTQNSGTSRVGVPPKPNG